MKQLQRQPLEYSLELENACVETCKMSFSADTRVVGPLRTGPSKPLPSELEEFMQSSGDDGVIVVSFGATLSNVDKRIWTVLADSFEKLPQKVIWKLTEGNIRVITLLLTLVLACELFKAPFFRQTRDYSRLIHELPSPWS